MVKKILLVILFAGIAAAGIGVYFYFKPSGSYEDKKPDLQVDASMLLSKYQENEQAANALYLNKLIEVSGDVNSISEDENGLTNINLGVEGQMAMVICGMDSTVKSDFASIKSGQKVKLKGLCSGMLMDVVLVKCVLTGN